MDLRQVEKFLQTATERLDAQKRPSPMNLFIYLLFTIYLFIYLYFIMSMQSVLYNMSIASSKASSPQSAI